MTRAWRDSLTALLWTVAFTAAGYGAVALAVWLRPDGMGIRIPSDFFEFVFFIATGVVLLVFVRCVDGGFRQPLALGPLRLDRITLFFALATVAYQAVEILIFLSGLAGGINDLAPGQRTLRVLGAVNAIVMAPLVEEALFRGFIYTRVEKAAGRAWALVVSAVAFGAFHGENGLLYILAMIPAGLFFGYARMKSGTIALSMAIHAWMNGSIGLLALLMYGAK